MTTPATPPPGRGSSHAGAPIRVMLVDDSESSLRALSEVLRREPGILVVGSAADGQEALQQTLRLRPDLICLDLEMPRVDGFTFLRWLMARQPTPVIVVSSHARKQDVFKALELGALDFIPKPESEGLASIREELLAKLGVVRALSIENIRTGPTGRARPAGASAGTRTAARLAVVASSTGGPAAVARLLHALPADLPLAVAVAQHMPERFTRAFAERLAKTCAFEVREAEEGDEVLAGRALIAPGGLHLKLVRAGGPLGPVRATLVSPGPSDGPRYCPSADVLFASAADVMGDRVCGVVLTGMGSDGRLGVQAVKEAGGLTLAESEQSAVVYGMPKEAVETGKVDDVLSLEAIVARILQFSSQGR